MLELLGRAVTALESLADNTKRLADTQDKSIKVAKKMMGAVTKMIDNVPDEVKAQDEFVLVKVYIDELAEAINEL